MDLSVVRHPYPPEGAAEAWALAKYSENRQLTDVAVLFGRAKYQADVAALGLLVKRFTDSLKHGVPPTSMLHAARQIVIVPSSRGVAMALASALAAAMNVTSPLAKISLTRPISSMNDVALGDRPAHVAGAFRLDRTLKHDKILLVDDVIDTGSTMAEAIRAVRLESPAVEVVCVAAVAVNRRSMGGSRTPLLQRNP
jgi:predicted amidophosphoribosyltransferase